MTSRSTVQSSEIHVWLGRVEDLPAPETLLNDDELARASRFHFPRHRHQFCAGRGMLRSLLAAYCGVPAAAIAFELSASGKPFLAHSDLHFNLSHSGALVVCAFARCRRIGIDVEL